MTSPRRALRLAALLSLSPLASGCGGDPTPPTASELRIPCPIFVNSRWPQVLCDRGDPTPEPRRDLRYSTLEACATDRGVFVSGIMPSRTPTSTHAHPNVCPGLLLITASDAAAVYR